MINGCVKGIDDCGCECHRIPGVKHVMPCCSAPPAPEGVTEYTEWPISPLKVPITWIKDRDLGDEDDSGR